MPAWKDMTPEQREERVAAMKAGKAAAKGRQKAPSKPAKAPSGSVIAADPVMVTLSEEEITEIRKRAIADVTSEKKKELMAAELVRQKRLVAESMGLPVEPEPQPPEEFSFRPQLAEFAPHLRIDGRYYFHGVTYHGLDQKQYDTLRSMEAETWKHQATIDGKRQNYYNQNSRLWQQNDGGHPSGSARRMI